MMHDRVLTLAGVVAAAGRVEGRKRVQKLVYILQRMGFDLGFRDFAMWHYGPFSSALASTLDCAS